jgi:hypothetical protein
MGAKTYRHGFPLTPNDTANLVTIPSAVYVGTTGNVNCILAADYSNSTVFANTLFVGLLTGTIYDYKIFKIHATGTTANNLIGLN